MSACNWAAVWSSGWVLRLARHMATLPSTAATIRVASWAACSGSAPCSRSDPASRPSHSSKTAAAAARAVGVSSAGGSSIETASTGQPALAVEATGLVDQLALALKCLAPEGICESAGNHFRPGELPLLDMYLTGVTLRVARDSVRAHLPDALALAASGRVDPGKVVSHVIDWEDLPAALPEKHLKPVFVRAGVRGGS